MNSTQQSCQLLNPQKKNKNQRSRSDRAVDICAHLPVPGGPVENHQGYTCTSNMSMSRMYIHQQDKCFVRDVKDGMNPAPPVTGHSGKRGKRFARYLTAHVCVVYQGRRYVRAEAVRHCFAHSHSIAREVPRLDDTTCFY